MKDSLWEDEPLAIPFPEGQRWVSWGRGWLGVFHHQPLWPAPLGGLPSHPRPFHILPTSLFFSVILHEH